MLNGFTGCVTVETSVPSLSEILERPHSASKLPVWVDAMFLVIYVPSWAWCDGLAWLGPSGTTPSGKETLC